QKADNKLRFVSSDEETLRVYEMREKAQFDWTSGLNHARREGLLEGERKGLLEGERKGKQEILNLLKSGKSLEEILRAYDKG
ncbi:MAG: hypothetical protein LBD20_01160, partial [Spirochaetaceae bacterium]|nr:hypothetical protein [Spirochaetaceae bacterium]